MNFSHSVILISGSFLPGPHPSQVMFLFLSYLSNNCLGKDYQKSLLINIVNKTIFDRFFFNRVCEVSILFESLFTLY